MRVLVCGGRDYADSDALFGALDAWHAQTQIACVISGCAPGADSLALEWARKTNVPVVRFPADWRSHGRAAGPIRNQRMICEGKPDLVMAFPGGRGTADMAARALKAGVRLLRVQS